MPKDTFYFSHDYNARNDEKILELRANHGAEGYGIFWMVVEAMAEGSSGGLKATNIGGLALGFGLPKHKLMEVISSCVSIGLFYENDGNYYSKRLLSHKEAREAFSKWGKIGAEKRREANGGASANKGNKRKGNENIQYKGDEENDFVCYDAEKMILANEQMMMHLCNATGKTPEEIKEYTKDYHLWMAKKEQYPVGKKAAIAGIESWVRNDKKFNNGKSFNPSGKSAKLGTAAKQSEAVRDI